MQIDIRFSKRLSFWMKAKKIMSYVINFFIFTFFIALVCVWTKHTSNSLLVLISSFLYIISFVYLFSAYMASEAMVDLLAYFAFSKVKENKKLHKLLENLKEEAYGSN